MGVAAAQNLPRLGEDGLMPLSDELRIGVDVARSLYSQPDYLDDPLLVEYVDGIFSRLMAAGRANGSVDPAMGRFPWRVLQGADTQRFWNETKFREERVNDAAGPAKDAVLQHEVYFSKRNGV